VTHHEEEDEEEFGRRKDGSGNGRALGMRAKKGSNNLLHENQRNRGGGSNGQPNAVGHFSNQASASYTKGGLVAHPLGSYP